MLRANEVSIIVSLYYAIEKQKRPLEICTLKNPNVPKKYPILGPLRFASAVKKDTRKLNVKSIHFNEIFKPDFLNN